MSTTLTAARTRLRTMLRESSANQWTDAHLNELLQDHNWAVYKKIAQRRGAGYGELQETITLAADATTFSLTAGSNPTALTKNLKAILFVEHQGLSGFWNLCNELQEADEFRYRAQNAIVATGDVPPLYRLRRPNIVFLPASAAARTLRITYRPLPTVLTGSDNMDVDDDYLPIVLYRAAEAALAELGEDETQFAALAQLAEEEMYVDLQHANAEGRSLVVKPVESASLLNF